MFETKNPYVSWCAASMPRGMYRVTSRDLREEPSGSDGSGRHHHERRGSRGLGGELRHKSVDSEPQPAYEGSRPGCPVPRPLLYAAFDLRSRLYSIAERHALCTDLDRDRDYQSNYTLFVISQYLGWAEVLRRGIQFLDLGENKRNRKLADLIFAITSVFATETIDDANLRLERGVQRAIGELMISVPVTGDDSFDCIGYATFCTRLQSDAQFAAWLRRVDQD